MPKNRVTSHGIMPILICAVLPLYPLTAFSVDYPVLSLNAESTVDAYKTATKMTGAVYTFTFGNMTVSGSVRCPQTSLPYEYAWHSVAIRLPYSSTLGRYVINENVSAQIELPVKFSGANNWIKYDSTYCASLDAGGIVSASLLGNAFPIKIHFFVDKATADGFISIPPMEFGSYARVFSDSPSGPSMPVGAIKTIPINIKRLQIQLPASCEINPQSIEIDHGVIPPGKDALAKVPFSIVCTNNLDVEFNLSGGKPSTGTQHLTVPLRVSGSSTAMNSELYLTTSSGEDAGYKYNFTIPQNTAMNFSINSFISKADMTQPGNFNGSAWLVAYIK